MHLRRRCGSGPWRDGGAARVLGRGGGGGGAGDGTRRVGELSAGFMGRAYLGILAMARNECPSYPEWLAHYRSQGVERFFIIDNNSSDGCEPYLAKQTDVTTFFWAQRSTDKHKALANATLAGRVSSSNQAIAYNYFLPNVTSEWVGVVDIDEYLFGVNESIATHLRGLDQSIRQVCAPWIIFGSGNLTRQPSCVTTANVLRAGSSDHVGKCLMRTDLILAVEIHRSVMVNETYHRRAKGCKCGDGTSCNCCGHTGPSAAMACNQVHTWKWGRQKLRLHHYISQSRGACVGDCSRSRSCPIVSHTPPLAPFLEDANHGPMG